MREYCAEKLGKLTDSGFVFLTKRGNISIRLALKLAKSLGFKKVLLQDQGGWITYKQFCKKEKLAFEELKTDLGVLDASALKEHHDCVLLINSMPGYSALIDMKSIEAVCKKNSIFLINDASGSIGTKEACFGDIILGSFGIDKPINLGEGGFIVTKKKEHADFLEKNNSAAELDYIKLKQRLDALPERLHKLKEVKNKLIQMLESAEFASKIVHKDRNAEEQGINLIVRFDSEPEKERLINICEKEKIEHTICPRDIRIKENAVCFEIKRLQ